MRRTLCAAATILLNNAGGFARLPALLGVERKRMTDETVSEYARTPSLGRADRTVSKTLARICNMCR